MENTKSQKIQYAIQNNPLLIGTLLKDTSINKGLIYRKLKKAIPCRIGIEFELAGSFRAKFREEHKISKSIRDIDKLMTKYYKVWSIKSDFGDTSLDSIYEIRISLIDFHELAGLYKFMQDLPRYCALHENGGIHIHVDISKYRIDSNKLIEVQKYITHRLDEVAAIFPKYTGTYNEKKVGYRKKATWVNISRLDTLEFRIAPLTFDYKTLMSWILKLVKFRNELISKCRLTKGSIYTDNTSHNLEACVEDICEGSPGGISYISAEEIRRIANCQWTNDLNRYTTNDGTTDLTTYSYTQQSNYW